MTEQICPIMSLAASKIRRVFGIPVKIETTDNYTEQYEDFVMCHEDKCRAWNPTLIRIADNEEVIIDGYCKLIERRRI